MSNDNSFGYNANKRKGKHVKQNPKVPNYGILIMASILTVTTLTSCAKAKTEQTSQEIPSDTYAYTETNYADFNPVSVIKEIETLNNAANYYDGNQQYRSTFGYFFEFIEYKLSQEGLTLEEKDELFSRFLNGDEELMMEAINYANNHTRNHDFVAFQQNSVIKEKIDAVLNDSELMEYIKEYSKMYGVPEDLILAMAAYNAVGERIDNIDPIGIQDFWLGTEINTSRSAHNLITNKDDDLGKQRNICNSCELDQKKENYVKFACMLIAQNLKECNGNLSEAIEYFYSGKSGIIDENKKLEARQYRDAVLSYLLTHLNATYASLDYSYTLSSTSSSKFMRIESTEHQIGIYNYLIRQVIPQYIEEYMPEYYNQQSSSHSR